MTEPDLDEPGKPLDWRGVSIPQTKRDNCADAATEAGGLDEVTDADLAEWELTRREFDEFRMDHVKARKEIAGRRAFHELQLSGPPNRDEYIRVLKLLRPDDWQKYVLPE